MARRNVLVTGGCGYIGSHVVLCCLLARKFNVATIDNFHNSYPEAAERVSQIALSELPKDASEDDKAACKVALFKGDITNPADLEAVFEAYKDKGGIWGVIHIAALKAVGESGERPIDYYKNNINSSVSLIEIMNRYGCHHMVYSSSATVYGAPETIPIPESTPLDAQSVYGRTKQMTETIMRDVADSDPSKWRMIALRYFNPAGAHPSGLIGEDPVGKPGNLLPLLAQIAVGRIKDELQVFGNDYPTPDGACVRDYIHIMDLAEGHIVALEALEREATFKQGDNKASQFGGSGGKFKAYNLGKGRGMSVFNMIDAMKKATGFDYKYKIVGRRIGDVPDLTADPALAEKELGFKAKRDLDEMCATLWKWQSMHPQGYATK